MARIVGLIVSLLLSIHGCLEFQVMVVLMTRNRDPETPLFTHTLKSPAFCCIR